MNTNHRIRPIPSLCHGHPNYGAGEDGVIYSITNHHGTILANPRPLKIATGTTSRQYPSVVVRVNGKRIAKRIANLVAEAWLPTPSEGQVVVHRDGDKNNAAASNLAYGEHPNQSALSERRVMAIYASKESGRVLSQRYGISQSCVSSIRRGKTHSAITGGVRDTPRQGDQNEMNQAADDPGGLPSWL